jgi:hypothetical protein
MATSSRAVGNPSTPSLQGAKSVRFQLDGRHHADVRDQVEVVEDAWREARRILSRAGGLCHCGNRWGHLMNGVEVTLLDKAPYTARCWDDDRLLIHLKKFSEEPDGGVGVLVHEFGHRVWFQCLSREQQDEWTASFKKAKSRCKSSQRTRCGGLVSDYAYEDDLEDFAETFRTLVYGTIDKKNLQRWLDVCGCDGVGAGSRTGSGGRSNSCSADDFARDWAQGQERGRRDGSRR